MKFSSIKDRIKFFEQQSQANNKSTNKTSSNNPNFGIKSTANKKDNDKNITDKKNTNFTNDDSKNKDPNNKSHNAQYINKNENTKIIGNDSLEEKGHLKIYKYPEGKSFFSKTGNANEQKIILFLGNAQECFINTFINIYRGIEFKDEFRQKIVYKNIKTNYYIFSFDNTEHIRITSIPFGGEKSENYIRENILAISKMKIDLVFYTFDKNIVINQEKKEEIEFYKYLINFLDFRDKLIFLCNSKEESKNEDINKFLNRFNIQKNDDIYEKEYTNKIFFINNEIIYDTNNNDDIQKEWEMMSLKMKEIREIIKSEKTKNLKKDEFFEFLLNDNKYKVVDYFKKLLNLKNKDKYYFLYFLGDIKFVNDRSYVLTLLVNEMLRNKHKELNKNNKILEFIDNHNYRCIIRPLSKIPFSNLNSILFRNCGLNDNDTLYINNLLTTNLENLDLSDNDIHKLNLVFTEKLENLKNLDLSRNKMGNLTPFTGSNLINLTKLNLSYNNLSNIEGLGKKANFTKLKILNLSNNNITNISSLFDIKFPDLIELNLSFNKIENIDFMELNTSLNNLEKFDLSNNKITKLVKIDFKSIKYFNLLSNYITDGVIDFIQSITNLSQKLTLEKLTHNSFIFDYSGNLDTKFEFFLKDGSNITQFLGKISFSGINYLKLKGFDDINIKFFSNDSLKDLKELDIKENSLSIISIFDNISFPNINKIIVNKNDFYDDSLENLIKNFPSIKVNSININDQRINIKYNNPELEINVNNFNILYDNFGKVDKISIEVLPHNLKIFSYESFRDKKLPIFENLKVDNLEIYLGVKKYSCNITFKLKLLEFKAFYYFDNLDFMKSDEILSETNKICFYNMIIGQNINIEKDIAYKKINTLIFENCTIENDDIFEEIINIQANKYLFVYAKETKYIPKNRMKKNICILNDESLSKYQEVLNYKKPFDFTININVDSKFDLIEKANLENIVCINFSNMGIKNLDFLANDTLVNLDLLYLNNNNIEDISIFDEDKIHFHKLYLLNLEGNPIREGLEVLKKNFFQKCESVKLELSLIEPKVLVQFNFPKYNLTIFVDNLNEIPNFFQKDKVNFRYSSSEEADKFREIFGFETEEFEKKSLKNYKPPIDKLKLFASLPSGEDVQPNIIIDNGTKYMKAGLCGEEGPRSVFPSCVKLTNHDNDYFGKGVSIKLNYPINRGVPNNWDDLEKIWGKIFTNELRIAPEEHNILLTEIIQNPKENREKMAQIMFETFNVAGLYIAKQVVLSLYSIGQLTGFVLDSGDSVTQIAPIFDGYYLPHASILKEIGGRDLTQLMKNLLVRDGYKFSVSTGNEIANTIKEKACYVAYEYQDEVKSVESFNYKLPDNTYINIKEQRIRCPESLFDPALNDNYEMGIAQDCFYSIKKCDSDLWKELYNCIVLSGGNTMFRGLEKRLTKEIKSLAPESMKQEVRVIASPERKFHVWIGGSVLSAFCSIENRWITKMEYEDEGATIVHRKCF